MNESANERKLHPLVRHPDCQLDVEPFFQCCCTCIYRMPVHYHCCTEPKPTDEQKRAAGIERRCVCGVQKGWACVAFEFERVYDNWPEHSCGCELHTTCEEAANIPPELRAVNLHRMVRRFQ